MLKIIVQTQSIDFEVNISTSSVNFLDVTVVNRNGNLETTLYTKPTDAHLYLNANSCHPPHVVKNIPKGLFIRIRRICSEKSEYLKHARQLQNYLIKRGYNGKILPVILKKHHHVLKNDVKLSQIFETTPTVAYRKIRSIGNHVVHSDIRKGLRTSSSKTVPCGRCKLCSNIMDTLPVANTNLKISGGDCKSRNVIYAAWCKKHHRIYVGQTGEKLSDRFAKHRYDIKKRPGNSELAEHFHNDHNIETDMGVVVLQQLKDDNPHARIHFEDRWICRLQSLQPKGINLDVGGFAREMYSCYKRFS